MLERKQETKLVKTELAKYGIKAKVTHGRGTGWGWLHISVGNGRQFSEEHFLDEYHTHRNCPRCKAAHIICRFAEKIAQQVTGRNGEYGGRINCDCRFDGEYNLSELFKILPELAEITKP